MKDDGSGPRRGPFGNWLVVLKCHTSILRSSIVFLVLKKGFAFLPLLSTKTINYE